jgi:hypothetical protein
MITVYEDVDLGFRFKWNQGTGFQVWHGDQEVDYFSTMEQVNLIGAINLAMDYCRYLMESIDG